MSALILSDIAPQLDALKIVTITDGEVWSARDLMLFAGYERWERFSDAINRAIASVNTSGLDASEHFRGAAKSSPMPNGGSRQIEDVELTRVRCHEARTEWGGAPPTLGARRSSLLAQLRRPHGGNGHPQRHARKTGLIPTSCRSVFSQA